MIFNFQSMQIKALNNSIEKCNEIPDRHGNCKFRTIGSENVREKNLCTNKHPFFFFSLFKHCVSVQVVMPRATRDLRQNFIQYFSINRKKRKTKKQKQMEFKNKYLINNNELNHIRC